MELVEIVLQGVAGFPQSARVQLGAGLTAVTSSNLQQFDTLVGVTLDLLSPSSLENPVLPLVVTSAESSRTGVHVRGRDGFDYRVLKDVRAGQTTLLRKQGDAMAPMSQDAQEIRQTLASQVGFPTIDVIRRVFVLRRADLPSVAGVSADAPVEKTSPNERTQSFADQPLPPGFSDEGPSAAYTHLSDDEKRARLEEIKGQIDQGKRIRELEFKLDGMQKRAFELEEKSRPIAKMRQEVEEATRALEHFADVVDVPGDFRAQIDRSVALRRSHGSELAELERTQTALEEAHAIRLREKPSLVSQVIGAFDDKLVKIGVGSGLFAIAIAALGAAVGVKALQWVAFLDIPAFFVAVLGGMRVISEVERKDQARIKLLQVQKDKDRLRAKAELDETAFNALLARYGLSLESLGDIDAAIEALEHKRALTVKLEGAKSRLDAALRDPDAQGIEATLATHRDAIKTLEEDLYEAGGYLVDPATLAAEARALEDSLTSPPSAVRPTSVASEGASARKRPVHDVIGGIISACTDLTAVPAGTLVDKLTPRLSQYVAGMSGGRLTGIRFLGTTNLVAIDTNATETAFVDLDPRTQDLVYIALQLTAAELYVRSTRMPIVVDRAFDVFAPEADGFNVRLVQFLATLTQVLMLTDRHTLMAGATTTIQL